ncbi:MAG: M48 family metalloprotease [Armatimonadota bacterium]
MAKSSNKTKSQHETGGFPLRAVRPVEEARALRAVFIAAVSLWLVIALLIALVLWRVPDPLNITLTVMLLLWGLGPYVWLGLRAQQAAQRLRNAYPIDSGQAFLPGRQDLQPLLHRLVGLFDLPSEPQVVLAPGDAGMFTIGHRMIIGAEVLARRGIQIYRQRLVDSAIVITNGLYAPARDEVLAALLFHEVGHAVAGHLSLLGVARALPDNEKISGGLRFLLLPALYPFILLADWARWAEVTADRLMYLIGTDYDIAVRCIMIQSITSSPNRAAHADLLAMMESGDTPADDSEKVKLSARIDRVLRENTLADFRLQQVRQWRESEAYTAAVQAMQQRQEAPI